MNLYDDEIKSKCNKCIKKKCAIKDLSETYNIDIQIDPFERKEFCTILVPYSAVAHERQEYEAKWDKIINKSTNDEKR